MPVEDPPATRRSQALVPMTLFAAVFVAVFSYCLSVEILKTFPRSQTEEVSVLLPNGSRTTVTELCAFRDELVSQLREWGAKQEVLMMFEGPCEGWQVKVFFLRSKSTSIGTIAGDLIAPPLRAKANQDEHKIEPTSYQVFEWCQTMWDLAERRGQPIDEFNHEMFDLAGAHFGI